MGTVALRRHPGSILPAMTCGHESCANPGVNSCSTCGGLFCGKHSVVHSGGAISVICRPCQERRDAEQLAQAQREAAEEAAADSQRNKRWAIAALIWYGFCGLLILIGKAGGTNALGWGIGLAITPIALWLVLGAIILML